MSEYESGTAAEQISDGEQVTETAETPETAEAEETAASQVEESAEGTENGSEAAEAAEATEAASGQAETAEAASGGGETEESAPPEISVPVILPDGEKHNYSLKEAASLAALGVRAQPIFEKLRYCAASSGKSIEETVEGFIAADEKIRYDALLSECGGNEEAAKRLLEFEKAEHKAAAEKILQGETEKQQQREQAVIERQANEFRELCDFLPEIKSVDDLPDKVLADSVEKGISLLDAYLRYRETEKRKVEKNEQKQTAAAAAAAGPAAAPADNPNDSVKSAILNAIWG